MTTTRRVLAALAALTLLLAACSGGDDGRDGDGATGAADPAPGATTDPADDGPCAWGTRADATQNNVAYPDTAATYWAIAYALTPGEELELAGTFPAARYASFISYGPAGGAIDVLADRDIVADAGGTNPFADGGAGAGDDEAGGDGATPDGEAGGTGTYTVRITGDEPQSEAGSAPNVLAGLRGDVAPEASGGAPEPTFPEGEGPELGENTLGSGAGDDDAVVGTTLLRIYLADDPADASGGGLPEVSLVGADGTRTPIPTCTEQLPNPRARELAEANGPPTDREAPSQPVFIRPQTGVANLFPNPDNTYLATIAFHRPGVVAVVTGRAAEVPEQVRFWSLCTNEYRKPYPVTACVPDSEVVTDDDGDYTFVISTPEDRPATATEADGVTWIDWGSTEVDAILLMRHMLADPDEPTSAVNVEPGALVQTTMGPYAPIGRYCTVADFDALGAECTPL